MIKDVEIAEVEVRFGSPHFEGFVDIVFYTQDGRHRAKAIGWTQEDKDEDGNFTEEFLNDAFAYSAPLR